MRTQRSAAASRRRRRARGYCVDLAPDDADIGGKARSLARLARLDLPVPPAFAVTGALFRALRAGGPPLPAVMADVHAVNAAVAAVDALRSCAFPSGFEDEIATRLDALGAARLCVRSSFAVEDDPRHMAPGVYASHIGVARAAVLPALRDVLASALSPGAVAYHLRGGCPPEEGAFAVLIHPYLDGSGQGSAAWDPEGAEREPRIEAWRGGTPAPTTQAALAAAVVAAARSHGAVEIEWIAEARARSGRSAATFLQLRGYTAPAAPRAWSGASGLDGAAWKWDAEHNPWPLSPAQAGLVALVDQRCRIGYRQRVVGGYLFAAPDETRRSGARVAAGAGAGARARRTYQEIETLTEAGVSALGDEPPIEVALDLFVAVYQPMFGVLRPALRRACDALAARLRTHHPQALPHLPALLGGAPSAATERRALAGAPAKYRARFGDESPVWDVAVPTYGERRQPRAARARSVRTEARRSGAANFRFDATTRKLVTAAREAAALGEDDDRLYARVQAAVRRALSVEGRRLRALGVIDDADDVFWLPLDLVRAFARGGKMGARRGDVRALVTRAREAHSRALMDPPPLPLPASADATRAGIIRGAAGSGGRAVGRVVHLGAPSVASSDPGSVIVATTILPTELPLLSPAALVVETGGALGHVAAQARERGLPAVVGAAGAVARLREGDPVLVDADAALVVRL